MEIKTKNNIPILHKMNLIVQLHQKELEITKAIF